MGGAWASRLDSLIVSETDFSSETGGSAEVDSSKGVLSATAVDVMGALGASVSSEFKTLLLIACDPFTSSAGGCESERGVVVGALSCDDAAVAKSISS